MQRTDVPGHQRISYLHSHAEFWMCGDEPVPVENDPAARILSRVLPQPDALLFSLLARHPLPALDDSGDRWSKDTSKTARQIRIRPAPFQLSDKAARLLDLPTREE